MALKASLCKDGVLKIAREDTTAIAAAIKAWVECQQRVQVHRRMPNPGSLKHAVAKPKAKRRLCEPLRECDPEPAFADIPAG